jgi:hypothetical protein
MSTRTIVSVSNDPLRAKGVVEVLSAAQTLTAADSGKIFIMSAAAGKTITLPALEAGLSFKFIVGAAFGTSDWILDSAEGDNIEGVLIVNGASVIASGEDQVNFVNSAETVGDYAELYCDGTNWFVYGVGAAAGGITVTDPS